MDVTELCELSSETNGAKILFSTDDLFGIAENLIKEKEPNINTVKISYSPDAWLTKRRGLPQELCNFVIIQLAARAEIHFICIDTASLVGDVALQFSVQAKSLVIGHEDYQNRSDRLGKHANRAELLRIEELDSKNWPQLISQQPLNPGYPSMNKKFFIIPSTKQDYTHLRLNIYPDGGISRLRVYGKVSIPVSPAQQSPIDLISKIYGGNCIAYSSYYNNSHPNNLIKPTYNTSSIGNSDGWQTMRNFMRSTRGFSHSSQFGQIIGEEWAIFQLGYSGKINEISINTIGGEGNSPYVVKVQGLEEDIIINDRNDIYNDIYNESWLDIVPLILVNRNSDQSFTIINKYQNTKIAYVKLTIKPDGCVTRFRVLGVIQ